MKSCIEPRIDLRVRRRQEALVDDALTEALIASFPASDSCRW